MQIDVAEFSKPCACGHVHEIVVDDMIIEKGAIKRLPQIMKDRYSQYKKIAMLCDDNTYLAAGKTVEELLPGIITIRLDSKNLHADEHGVEAAEKQLKEYKNIDFMIAVGSGTIHDITRYHAYEKKIPFLSVPTAASVDGFVSTVAAMTWHGFKKSFTAVAPCFVLADSEIFSKAPLRLTASGVGDLLGKYTALCDWKIAHIITGEYICDKVVDMEYEVLKDLCANLDGIGSQNIEAYENLMYGLLLSGIAMQMIGNSRPASGAEHHMSHQPDTGSPQTSVLTTITAIIIKESTQNSTPTTEASESGATENPVIPSTEYLNNFHMDHLVFPAERSILSYCSHFVRNPTQPKIPFEKRLYSLISRTACTIFRFISR